MSDPGTLPDLPAQPETQPRKRSFRGLLAALLVVVLAGGGYLAWTQLEDDSDDGPSYPSKWDARILPFVKITEEERGLDFKHPVTVRFLEPKKFEESVKADEKDLDADEKKEIEQLTALFRAFGLIDGDVDLFKSFNDAQGSGTLAYYSFEDQRITIKGTELEVGARATLVHELTHALQDQWFDIGERLEDLREEANDGAASTAYDTFDGIVEGDAERTADLYRKTLSSKERTALEKAESKDEKDATDAYDKLPSIVISLLTAPYVLGQALTEAVTAEDEDAIDDLFRDPPGDDKVLLDPLTALGEDDLTSPKVKVPGTEDGEKKFDSGQMGALFTYLVLSQRLPVREALQAADTWNGDAFVAFERDGSSCARVDYVVDEDTDDLLKAFRTWTAKGDGAEVEATEDGLVFEACDPGATADVDDDKADEALELVAVRSYLGVNLLSMGAPNPAASACVARGLVDTYTVKQITDPTFGAEDKSIQNYIRDLALRCASENR